MIPTYPYSLSSSSNSPPTSTMPIIDLNIAEDQSHELIFSPTHQPSSSSSSLSCPIPFNPPQQDHAGSSYWESNNLHNDHVEAGKNIIASSGSWNDQEEKGGVEIRKRGLKLKVWKRSASGSREREDDENHQITEDNDPVKWMPSKMRMMRKMMASDHKASSSSSSDISIMGTSRKIINSEDQNQNQQRPLLLSPRGGTDNSSSSINSSTHSNSNNNNNTITVRVCADCHTTKTPLWRSGPRGPKSLCNACGIRQRKARRAMAAAAAAANESSDLHVAGKSAAVKGTYRVHSKEKKLKLECETHQMKKKKHKLDEDHHQDMEANNNNNSRGRSSSSSPTIINKFSFEDFTVSLMSKNLAAASQVFPQDEKEAAILLMALSCNGLVHG
ncbi:GATA transcription factor 21 [Neltuma alba]|uniref:GATA transcription factor 21 n=1 Tax=Neltuma alba TaxID=207710 RepID=UPI0010A45BCD|nr:GATA transcription factor 21 [Prosopis alba]